MSKLQLIEPKNINTVTKQRIQKNRFNQSAELHRGQKYISNRIDAQIAIAFSIPSQDVIQLFRDIAKVMKFQMIQCQETYATAIKRPQKNNIFDMLNCLTWWGPSNNLNALKLTILNSPQLTDSTLKLCRVRALSQPTSQVLAFIQVFKEKLQKIKGSVPSTYLFQATQSTQQINIQNNSNPFHQQACSHYMFHKILTCNSGPQQKIHLNLQKALKQFFEAFKNIQQSSNSLPTPMKNVIDITKQTCEEISKFFTFKEQQGNNAENIMPFMKIAIEKYVFDRTETVLKTMYLHKDKQVSETFKQKKQRILTKLTKQQIFEQVLLNKNFRTIQVSPQNLKLRGGVQFCTISCPQLQKISLTSSPRQKVKHCQLMYAQLKSYFYEKLNKKYQLNTMQDIIPVLIVVVLYTEMEDLRSEINIMIDYIGCANQDFQAEKRLLVNLSESYNYIVRDWKI